MPYATSVTVTRDSAEVARYLNGLARAPGNSFLAKMWAQLRIERRPLSAAQASTSRKIMDQDAASAYAASLPKPAPVLAATAVASEPERIGRVLPKGIYTVVLDSGHVTLRVKPSRNPKYPSTLELLTGSNNDADYTSLGELIGGYFVTWGSRRYPPSWIDAAAAQRLVKRPDVALAIPILMAADGAGRAAAGQAWSASTEVWNADHTVLESVACYRCGRTLTVPSSIENGLGSDCASKVDG